MVSEYLYVRLVKYFSWPLVYMFSHKPVYYIMFTDVLLYNKLYVAEFERSRLPRVIMNI